jgi:hypothetical protein
MTAAATIGLRSVEPSTINPTNILGGLRGLESIVARSLTSACQSLTVKARRGVSCSLLLRVLEKYVMNHLLNQMVALLGIGVALALSYRVSRAVTRRLPNGDELVHPRIRHLRGDSFWPALRRGARIVAMILTTFVVIGGISWVGVIQFAYWIASLATSVGGFVVMVVVLTVTSVSLTAVVWLWEQVVHVILDRLDVSFRRVMPHDTASDTDRASSGPTAPTG